MKNKRELKESFLNKKETSSVWDSGLWESIDFFPACQAPGFVDLDYVNKIMPHFFGNHPIFSTIL